MRKPQSFHARLSSDQAALQASLPPQYLAPNGTVDGHGIVPDDNRDDEKPTAMSLLIAGGQETPYADGLWRLDVHVTPDYPRIPPRIIFRDQIWHPNVDEQSGIICSDTLTRDWDEKCTLKDALNTVSRLLYHPNAASISNPLAGELFRNDYDAFAHQAQTMTSRHAAIPSHMKKSVLQSLTSGQQNAVGHRRAPVRKPIPITRGYYHTRSMSMEIRLKNHNHNSPLPSSQAHQLQQTSMPQQQQQKQHSVFHEQPLAVGSSEAENDENVMQDEDGKENEDSPMEDDDEDDSKENDGPTTSMPSSPARRGVTSSLRRPVLGTKRPLSVLTTNNSDDEGDMVLVVDDDDDYDEYHDDGYDNININNGGNHNELFSGNYIHNSNNRQHDGRNRHDAYRLGMSDSERNIAANRIRHERNDPSNSRRHAPRFTAGPQPRPRKHFRLQPHAHNPNRRPFSSSSSAAPASVPVPAPAPAPVSTSLSSSLTTNNFPDLQIYEDPQSPSSPLPTSLPTTGYEQQQHHKQDQDQDYDHNNDLELPPLPDRPPTPQTPQLGRFVFKSQSANPSSSPSKCSGRSSLLPSSPHPSKVTTLSSPNKALPRQSKLSSSPQKPRIGLRRL